MQATVQPYREVVKDFLPFRSTGQCFLAQRNGREQYGVFSLDFAPSGETICETLETFRDRQEAEAFYDAAALCFAAYQADCLPLPQADERPFTLTEIGALVGRFRAIHEEMTDLAGDVQEGGRFDDRRHEELSEEYGAIETALRVLSPEYVPEPYREEPCAEGFGDIYPEPHFCAGVH